MRSVVGYKTLAIPISPAVAFSSHSPLVFKSAFFHVEKPLDFTTLEHHVVSIVDCRVKFPPSCR